jgi:hypothetical protein
MIVKSARILEKPRPHSARPVAPGISDDKEV